jgi:hypothetical protein
LFVLIIYAFTLSGAASHNAPTTLSSIATAEFNSLDACKRAADDAYATIQQFAAASSETYAHCYPKN